MASHPAGWHISRCSIKPEFVSDESKQPFHLNPWEICILNLHYIQKGLLFSKPPPTNKDDPSINTIIDRLKDSLSRTLVHFLPLAGHLVTHKQDDPPSYSISVDLKNPLGVDFVHAVADVTIADVLSPIDVPPIVQSFFLLNKVINHDGHTLPLLAVQATELLDGIFIACSFNHVVGDGTSFWHFFNTWAEICRMMITGKHADRISRPPPVLRRWSLYGHGPIFNLPFSHHDEFIDRYAPPVVLRERFFHFSPESIARLKAKANAECNMSSSSTISSFQALSAFVWRSVTRARSTHLPTHQETTCLLAIDNRSRLNPPLTPDYFGSYIETVKASATIGELLGHGIGWAAWLLHEAVNGHTDSKVRGKLKEWMKSPIIGQSHNFSIPCSVMIGSSPRFDVYGCDFGWGKAEAIRSGPANKFDGKVCSYPGHHGGGSVELEVSLYPESMSALESDQEFMDAMVSSN